jgi:tetratricopeptide (TPR) repeat protein
MDIRCASCGRLAPEGAKFRRARKGLLWRAVFYCPACFARRGRGGHWLLLLVFLAWTTLGITPLVVAALGPADKDLSQADLEAIFVAHSRLMMRGVGWFLLNVSLFFVLLAPLIAAHEAGHALGAWLVGLRVFLVRIGEGRLLGSIRVGKVRWELRAFVANGATYQGYPTLRFFRLKFFLVVLAGPLMNATVLAAALWWRPLAVLVGQIGHWSKAPGLLPLPVFVVGSLFLLLMSLVPHRFRAAGTVHASDGLQLLLAPFLSRAVRENTHALYFFLEGGDCLSERRCADALRWYERGLEHYPHCPINRLGASCALIEMRRFDEADLRLADLRGRNELGRAFQALVEDAAATAVLGRVIEARCRRPDDLGAPEADTSARLAALFEEGERRSQEALDAGSKLPPSVQWSLMGTYGSLLVERGRLDEGAVILRLALAEVEGASARAYCQCYLAVVAARQGRPEEARAALEKARRLCPDHIALERAEWQLIQGA